MSLSFYTLVFETHLSTSYAKKEVSPRSYLFAPCLLHSQFVLYFKMLLILGIIRQIMKLPV